MRHIDIRDLWLQKEVAEGRTEVSKIPGEENPADRMTSILTMVDIKTRLRHTGIDIEERQEEKETKRKREEDVLENC